MRDLVREVMGFAPYEKRCIELLRISKDKRALKFCKKRVIIIPTIQHFPNYLSSDPSAMDCRHNSRSNFLECVSIILYCAYCIVECDNVTIYCIVTLSHSTSQT